MLCFTADNMEVPAAAAKMTTGWSTDDAQKFVMSYDQEVPLASVQFDIDCSEGQIRPLNQDYVSAKLDSFRRCLPRAPLKDILLWQIDPTGV